MGSSGIAITTTISGLNALSHRWLDTGMRSRGWLTWWRCGALLLVALLLGFAQGCAGPPERKPLPEDLYARSQVPGIPNARFWGDEAPPYAEDLMTLPPKELRARYPALVDQPIILLAISGGGSDGAFGAGMIDGWTASGTRPVFSFVTGISTGSLMAPFAYLGPEYDYLVKKVYTTYTTKDLVKKRGLIGMIEIDAVADSAPLRAVIAEHVDEEIMQAIAEEYRKGRFLLIGTTNLDAERPVVWNIGEIAASGAPGALDLIHDVMLASASVPVGFPPQMFEVEVDGMRYDEMHVDGGVSREFFLFSFGVDDKALSKRLGAEGQAAVYIIRNAKLKPKWHAVERNILQIAGRTSSSFIRTQGIGDLYREFVGAKAYGFDYNLAFIPASFDAESKELFDPEYMNALYQLGYDLASKGYPWKKQPPGQKPQ
ncbi:MAG: patatin [Proteobacteria bacterium]|nr:patatin [Pseudomonadota bacterium]